MTTTPDGPLRDEDIETTEAGGGVSGVVTDADGNGTADADATDTTDADGTDTPGADGTDTPDSDGTDG